MKYYLPLWTKLPLYKTLSSPRYSQLNVLRVIWGTLFPFFFSPLLLVLEEYPSKVVAVAVSHRPASCRLLLKEIDVRKESESAVCCIGDGLSSGKRGAFGLCSVERVEVEHP